MIFSEISGAADPAVLWYSPDRWLDEPAHSFGSAPGGPRTGMGHEPREENNVKTHVENYMKNHVKNHVQNHVKNPVKNHVTNHVKNHVKTM